MKALLLAAAFAAASPAQAGEATLRIVDRQQPMPVEAIDASTLQQALARLLALTGSHGATGQNIEVRYVLEPAAQRCRLADIEVLVTVTTRLPHWQPERRPPHRLREQWDAALAGLATHESGHRDHAVRAGETIRDALQALPSERDCATLAQHAQRIVHRQRFRLAMRDLVYDHRTAHGATQGAVLVVGEPPSMISRASAREDARRRLRPSAPLATPTF